MKWRWMLVLVAVALVGCGGGEYAESVEEAPAAAQALITVEAPEPLAVPEAKPVSSDEDWEAKAHNKNIEVIQVINVINPVAAYITAGFEKYGDRFSPTLHEEWEDTQAQLTTALTLYGSCKERTAAGAFDKQLFLDLEETWQMLVKTGVAGVRAKSMVDSELSKITG